MRNLISCLALGALLAPPCLAADATANPDLALVNRLSWGETAQGDTLGGRSARAWLEQQLHPSSDDGLPREVQAWIADMDISHTPLEEIAAQTRQMQMDIREAKRDQADPKDQADGKNGLADLRKPYRQKLRDLGLEAQTRSLLRDLYSRNQLKEQLTWFWLNHFNVYARKRQVAALVGDYEEHAIRPHVLGRFRDLLTATVFHPAMIQYLDNQQNAAGKINENYAREIMELHTMGVGSGYSQQDVQELARILTGVGVNMTGEMRPMARLARADYRTDVGQGGLFEFIPRRHDYGDKVFLGQTIKGAGVEEVNQAIAILARQPATARFVSRQLAQYFCCDAPTDALVASMAASWQRSDGDIAQVLRALFDSDEFNRSLVTKFKDPIHYAVSAVRASFGNRVIVNPLPLLGWLNRMGEPLYGHETPDGYGLTAAAWSGPGAMETRFEVAQAIGAGAPNLFRPVTPEMMAELRADLRPNARPGLQAAVQTAPQDRAAPPVLQQTIYYSQLAPSLSAATNDAIAKGASQADRNALLISSPEFMRR